MLVFVLAMLGGMTFARLLSNTGFGAKAVSAEAGAGQ
jgi:hypothetical protein